MHRFKTLIKVDRFTHYMVVIACLAYIAGIGPFTVLYPTIRLSAIIVGIIAGVLWWLLCKRGGD